LTILKAFAVFSEYSRVRGADGLTDTIKAEIRYNIGRAFHQLSLWTQADREYREALRLLDGDNAGRPPAVSHENVPEELRRMIAYNLHLIRMKNDQFKQARKLVFNHIVAS